MPKEVVKYWNEYVIRDSRVIYNPEVVHPGEQVGHSEEIALHWSKGDAGVVQLSVQLDAEMVRAQLKLYDAIKAGADVWLGEEVKPGMLMFYSEGLRREEMQRLIRHTRRSRDDVYGSDE